MPKYEGMSQRAWACARVNLYPVQTRIRNWQLSELLSERDLKAILCNQTLLFRCSTGLVYKETRPYTSCKETTRRFRLLRYTLVMIIIILSSLLFCAVNCQLPFLWLNYQQFQCTKIAKQLSWSSSAAIFVYLFSHLDMYNRCYCLWAQSKLLTGLLLWIYWCTKCNSASHNI